ncbi:hypothetical protein Acr_05g0014910 [Actinidia rufa]|uniref:Retrovirus-related Pol polyprotein from transposon TNT 1-94-like beta-barrel domain-containing protein n=1 Tax=Actinidia rufa TaxID=165716 RepID=A0A7J0ENF2_9ERIC|nr:hypothetical protein Acr_05g0014910 [Actinidia rufa]
MPKSWETLEVSISNSTLNGNLTTSIVMDALFNEEAQRREMGTTNQSESQALDQGRGHHRGTGKERWRSQTRGRTDQSSETTTTVVMVVDEDESDVLLATSEDRKSDWVLDSGSAYHLCKDGEVFFTYAAYEGRIWMVNNTDSRVVGRGSVRFHMADGRNSESFQWKQGDAVGKENLEGYIEWRGVSRQGELLSDMGPMVLARRVDKRSNRCIEVRKASAGVLEGSEMVPGGSGVLCAQGRRDGATKTCKMTYFAAYPGGEVEYPVDEAKVSRMLSCRSYGRAGSEAVRKDNLKTSDYPPVGWRGRLLSPAHLDESKPTWMSPSPNPIGVHMECPYDGETLELSRLG